MESLIRNIECDSWHRMQRRKFMGRSLSMLGGVSLTAIAENLARSSESSREPSNRRLKGKARSLIMLWLQGGPSQLDTFDPHPGTKIGGETTAISTSVKGIDLAASMPMTASQLQYVSLVRSIQSKEGDHERATYQMKTGWRPDPTLVHPSIGAILCHQTSDNLEIPRHISIQGTQWPARGGYLGGALDAFKTGDPKNRVPNLRSFSGDDRTKRRVDALTNVVEREFARNRFADLDKLKTQHETATNRALSMMASEQVEAFDVTQESESTRKAFGDSGFGRSCLAAVRLIECGVRCVEVELNGWDSHANNFESQSKQCDVLDPALASLIELLRERDLFDSTLIVCGGEFGRTPTINNLGGRDHWQHGFSWLIGGGPIRRGYVHGATSSEPTSDPNKRGDDIEKKVNVPDLHATLLDSLGIDFAQEIQTPIGRPLAFTDEGKVLNELIEPPPA
jgi:Protein of unknown function (DUF1501)